MADQTNDQERERVCWAIAQTNSRRKKAAELELLQAFSCSVSCFFQRDGDEPIDIAMQQLHRHTRETVRKLRDLRPKKQGQRVHNRSHFFLNLPIAFLIYFGPTWLFSPMAQDIAEQDVHLRRLDILNRLNEKAFEYRDGCDNRQREAWMEHKDIYWFKDAMRKTMSREDQEEGEGEEGGDQADNLLNDIEDVEDPLDLHLA